MITKVLSTIALSSVIGLGGAALTFPDGLPLEGGARPSADSSEAHPAPAKKKGDYPAALRAAERAVRRGERLSKAAPESWIRRADLAQAHYRLARLTGDYAGYAAAERSLDEAFALTGGEQGPHLLRAELDYTLHRFDRVGGHLDRAEREARVRGDAALSSQIVSLRGGLAMQLGRYDEARRLLGEAARTDRSYSSVARLADYHWKTGDFGAAERLYDEAMALLPRDKHGERPHEAEAWVELQRGLMDLDRGRYEAALSHYRAADAAFPGWWLVEEHIAEIDTLMGRTAKAQAAYLDLVERTGEPEFMDALAALAADDDRGRATWTARARGVYQARLAQFPEATFGHALGHYLEREPDREEALALARRNATLRPNGEALTKLAQAELRAGHLEEATATIDRALRSPWRSAETHATASVVHARAGEPKLAALHAARARALCPDAVRDVAWLGE